MRLRDAQVPVVLWICAAALLHFAGAEQSDHLVTLQEGKTKLRRAAHELATPGLPVMVADQIDYVPVDPEKPAEPEAAPPPEATPPDPKADEKKEEKKKEEKKKEEEKLAAATPPKAAPKLPELPDPEPNKKAEEKPTIVIPVPPEPPKDKKIAIKQHQKADDEANPEAKYWGDENHKVKPEDEMHSGTTSTTEDHPDPTPGTNNSGPSTLKPGNGDKDQVAHDIDRPGMKVAPNVLPGPTMPPPKAGDPGHTPGKKDGDDKKLVEGPKQPAAPVAKAPQKTSDGAGPTAPPLGAPEVMTGKGGTEVAAKPTPNDPGMGTKAPLGTGDGKPKSLPTLPTPGANKWVAGLGAGLKGDGSNDKLAISEKVFKGAIGQDELDKLKKVEAETKLSIHRGNWKSSSLERWRASIENYVPGVKTGNQTNLGTAKLPWASYLVGIHVRLHPIFADGFVEGLSDLPASHPLNDKTLVLRMEIVMNPDGTLHKLPNGSPHLGIVKPSGNTAFDIAALDAVDRAAPFGKAPTEIVSEDGLVYLHWEFHRDDMRCSNVNAYPYKLKNGVSPTPTTPEPEPKGPPPKNPTDGEKKMGLAPAKPTAG